MAGKTGACVENNSLRLQLRTMDENAVVASEGVMQPGVCSELMVHECSFF